MWRGFESLFFRTGLSSVLRVLDRTVDFREAVARYGGADDGSLDGLLQALFGGSKGEEADATAIMERLDIKPGFGEVDAADCFQKILREVEAPGACQLFQGQLKKTHTCWRCGFETSFVETFNSLPLDLTYHQTAYKLVDGVAEYFVQSVVSGANRLFCERCDAKCDAAAKIEMKHHPDVLVLRLRRFKFDSYYKCFKKIDRYVEFPYMLEIPHARAETEIYELYAFVGNVVKHKYGEFFATIKSQDNQKWYNFSDQDVYMADFQPFKVDINHRCRDVCLLFYRKVSATETLGSGIRDVSTSEKESRNREQQRGEDVETAGVVEVRGEEGGTRGGKLREEEQRKKTGGEERAGKRILTRADLCNNPTQSRGGEAGGGARHNDGQHADSERTTVSQKGEGTESEDRQENGKNRGGNVKKAGNKESEEEKQTYENKTGGQGAAGGPNQRGGDLRGQEESTTGTKQQAEPRSLEEQLQILFEDLKKHAAETRNPSQSNRVDVQSGAAECFENILRNVSAPGASQLFQGQLTHKTKCLKCRTLTSSEETFWSLPLSFEESNKDYKVVDGVAEYFVQSVVSGANQLFCERCDAKCDAAAKSEMTHHPDVLVLRLRRFKFDSVRRQHIKIDRYVEFPYMLEIPYARAEAEIYELYAFVGNVVKHKYGEFFATIKSQDNEKWYNFSDQDVYVVDFQPFKVDISHRCRDVCLLFYRKVSAAETLGSGIRDVSASEKESRNREQQRGEDVETAGVVEGRGEEGGTRGGKLREEEQKKKTGGEERAGKRILTRADLYNDPTQSRGGEPGGGARHNDGQHADSERTTVSQKGEGAESEDRQENGKNRGGNVKKAGNKESEEEKQRCENKTGGQGAAGGPNQRGGDLQGQEESTTGTKQQPEPRSLEEQLQILFEDLKKHAAETRNPSQSNRVDVQSDAAECFEHILRNVSAPGASQLFQGQLTHKTQCRKCRTLTSSEEPFWSLPLSFEESNKDYKVVDGVAEYFRPSVFSGANRLFCERCDAKCDAAAKSEMTHHPDVLVLRLRRFKFDSVRRQHIKIDRYVEFPYMLEIPYARAEAEIYELYAFVGNVVKHKYGEFFATIKSQDNEKWYNFSDQDVYVADFQPFKVDISHRCRDVCLLFYRKVSAAETLGSGIRDVSTSEKESRNREQQRGDDVETAGGVEVRGEEGGTRGGKLREEEQRKKTGGEERAGKRILTKADLCNDPTQSRGGEAGGGARHNDGQHADSERTTVSQKGEGTESEDRQENGKNRGGNVKEAGNKESEEDKQRYENKTGGQGAAGGPNQRGGDLRGQEESTTDRKQQAEPRSLEEQLQILFEDLKKHAAESRNPSQSNRVDVQSGAGECFENILRNVSAPGASQLFQGQLTHKTQCLKCRTLTSSEETFWSLPLSFEESNKDYKVVDGVAEYFVQSVVSGANQLFCERCDAKCDAAAKIEMKHHPDVLMLRLRRFKFDSYYKCFKKIDRYVEFPYMLEIPHAGAETEIYELYAFVGNVVKHKYGEFFATIKSQDNQKWYNFSDQDVYMVDFQPFKVDINHRCRDVCLLFYRKVSAAETLGSGIRDVSASEKESRNREQQRGDDVETAGLVEGRGEEGGNRGGKLREEEQKKKTGGEERAGTRILTKADLCNDPTQSRGGEAGGGARHNDGQHADSERTTVSQNGDRAKSEDRQENGKDRGGNVKKAGNKESEEEKQRCENKTGGQGAAGGPNQRGGDLRGQEESTTDRKQQAEPRSLDQQLQILFEDLKKHAAESRNLSWSNRVDVQSDAAECFENILRNVSAPGASQLFQGQLTHKTQCRKCCTLTSSEETFWSLPLSFEESNKEYKVVDGVAEYFVQSVVSGENQLFCERCDAKCDAAAMCEMVNHPEVLIVRLSRFKFDSVRRQHIKIDRYVEFPYMLEIPHAGAEAEIYELYAFVGNVVKHKYGEFFATIKSQDNEKWYNFSDQDVYMADFQPFKVNISHRCRDVCLLFYRKVSAAETLGSGIRDVSTSEKESRNREQQRGDDVETAGVVEGRGEEGGTRGGKLREEEQKKKTGGEERAGKRILTRADLYNNPTQSRGGEAGGGARRNDGQHADSERTTVSQNGDRAKSEDRQENGKNRGGNVKKAGNKESEEEKQRCEKKTGGQGAEGGPNQRGGDLRGQEESTTDRKQQAEPRSLEEQLQILFEDLKKHAAQTRNPSQSNRVDVQSDAAECFEKILRNVSAPGVSQLFQGQLTHKTQCLKCDTLTSSEETFWSLPLSFEESLKDYKVVDGVAEYFRPSVVSGANQLFCERCDAKCDAAAKCEMVNHPEVLVLQLKRFKFDSITKWHTKIIRYVEFPCVLEIPHAGAETEIYELCAFIEHVHGYKYGHHNVTIKSLDDGKWYDIIGNDVSLVHTQPFKEDMSHSSWDVCLLFYRKVSAGSQKKENRG
ncbi:uncharacterized protein ACNS7B_021055 [Menidia menidia]